MQSKASDLLSRINQLAKHPSFPHLSKIEHDLLLEHLRNLYEEISFAKENKAADQKQEVIKTDRPAPVPPVVKEQETIVRKLEEPPIAKEEPPVVKPEVQAKAAPKFSINEVVQAGESLNSKLKFTSAKEVHHKLSTKPMKELIDLNKRYLVVSELFKGDADACAKAIHQIDLSESYSAAESYIHSTLFPAYKWNESSEIVKLFQGLVKQKFGVE
jgi:hypothetical protein